LEKSCWMLSHNNSRLSFLSNRRTLLSKISGGKPT
jgi:hypothetical protein